MKWCGMLALFWGLVVNVWAGERLPGTRISLTPPEGFVKSQRFTGFMLPERQASIMVTPMLGVPFSTTSQALSDEALARQGMEVTRRVSQTLNSLHKKLVYVSQVAGGVGIYKWLMVIGDDSGSEIVVASFPKMHQSKLSEPLQEALIGAQWYPDVVPDPLEGLSFHVDEAGSLAVAESIGNNLFLTEGGVYPLASEGDPLVVVGASFDPALGRIKDQKALAHKRLSQTKVLSSVKVEAEQSVTIDGLEGYLIYAQGVDADTGAELYLEQCLLFDESGYYYLIQAMVESGRKEELQNAFAAIRNSFKRVHTKAES